MARHSYAKTAADVMLSTYIGLKKLLGFQQRNTACEGGYKSGLTLKENAGEDALPLSQRGRLRRFPSPAHWGDGHGPVTSPLHQN